MNAFPINNLQTATVSLASADIAIANVQAELKKLRKARRKIVTAIRNFKKKEASA